jgi:hypothetical protein
MEILINKSLCNFYKTSLINSKKIFDDITTNYQFTLLQEHITPDYNQRWYSYGSEGAPDLFKAQFSLYSNKISLVKIISDNCIYTTIPVKLKIKLHHDFQSKYEPLVIGELSDIKYFDSCKYNAYTKSESNGLCHRHCWNIKISKGYEAVYEAIYFNNDSWCPTNMNSQPDIDNMLYFYAKLYSFTSIITDNHKPIATFYMSRNPNDFKITSIIWDFKAIISDTDISNKFKDYIYKLSDIPSIALDQLIWYDAGYCTPHNTSINNYFTDISADNVYDCIYKRSSGIDIVGFINNNLYVCIQYLFKINDKLYKCNYTASYDTNNLNFTGMDKCKYTDTKIYYGDIIIYHKTVVYNGNPMNIKEEAQDLKLPRFIEIATRKRLWSATGVLQFDATVKSYYNHENMNFYTDKIHVNVCDSDSCFIFCRLPPKLLLEDSGLLCAFVNHDHCESADYFLMSQPDISGIVTIALNSYNYCNIYKLKIKNKNKEVFTPIFDLLVNGLNKIFDFLSVQYNFRNYWSNHSRIIDLISQNLGISVKAEKVYGFKFKLYNISNNTFLKIFDTESQNFNITENYYKNFVWYYSRNLHFIADDVSDSATEIEMKSINKYDYNNDSSTDSCNSSDDESDETSSEDEEDIKEYLKYLEYQKKLKIQKFNEIFLSNRIELLYDCILQHKNYKNYNDFLKPLRNFIKRKYYYKIPYVKSFTITERNYLYYINITPKDFQDYLLYSINYNYRFTIHYSSTNHYSSAIHHLPKDVSNNDINISKDQTDSSSSASHSINDNNKNDLDTFTNPQNQLSVSIAAKLPTTNITFGKKAAITDIKTKQTCIIKLTIPSYAKTVMGATGEKLRSSDVIVDWIRPVKIQKDKDDQIIGITYLEDHKKNECSICMNAVCQKIANPCRCKACSNCWEKSFKGFNCPFCKASLNNVFDIKILDTDLSWSLIDAYSFIDEPFRYERFKEIKIENFNDDPKQKCANGIHYNLNETDACKWFEYLEIPEIPEMKEVKKIPKSVINIDKSEIKDKYIDNMMINRSDKIDGVKDDDNKLNEEEFEIKEYERALYQFKEKMKQKICGEKDNDSSVPSKLPVSSVFVSKNLVVKEILNDSEDDLLPDL